LYCKVLQKETLVKTVRAAVIILSPVAKPLRRVAEIYAETGRCD